MDETSASLRKYANYRATADDMSAVMFRGADELDRLATLEAAVRKVIDLVNVYLPPDVGAFGEIPGTMVSFDSSGITGITRPAPRITKEQFISEVIGAVDNPDVFRALEKVK